MLYVYVYTDGPTTHVPTPGRWSRRQEKQSCCTDGSTREKERGGSAATTWYCIHTHTYKGQQDLPYTYAPPTLIVFHPVPARGTT